MSRIGTTSISSLMSGATAARTSQQAYDDNAAAYAFHNSAQTADDYNAYQDYLKKRQAETTDASKSLTLQKSADSAFTGYSSNELQRYTDAINTGEGNPQQKLDAIKKLYDQAISRGDMATAQNLQSGYIGLSKSIQTQAQVASDRAVAASDRAERQQTTAMKAGVSQQLAGNQLAQSIIDDSMQHNNGVLRVPIGGGKYQAATVTTGPDGNPTFAPDPTGKGMKMTGTDYAQLKSHYLQERAAYHQGAIDAGLDDTGSHQEAIYSLTKGNDWKQFGPDNKSIQASYGQGNTIPAFSTKINADGTRDAIATPTSKVPGLDANGNPITNTIATLGVAGEGTKSPTVEMNQRQGAGGLWEHYSVDANASPNVLPDGTPYVNPKNGKQFAAGFTSVNPNDPTKTLFTLGSKGIDGNGNNGIFNPGLQLPEKLRFDQNDLRAGHTLNAADYTVADAGSAWDSLLHPSQTVHGYADWATNPSKILATAKGALNNTIGFLNANTAKNVTNFKAQQAAQAQLAQQQAAAAAAQIAAARATPLNKPLPAGVNYAAKYINTPIAKIPGAPLPSAPVFSPQPGKPLTPAQTQTNTVNAINKAVGFGPAFNNTWYK